jgi:hypothetical protein
MGGRCLTSPRRLAPHLFLSCSHHPAGVGSCPTEAASWTRRRRRSRRSPAAVLLPNSRKERAASVLQKPHAMAPLAETAWRWGATRNLHPPGPGSGAAGIPASSGSPSAGPTTSSTGKRDSSRTTTALSIGIDCSTRAASASLQGANLGANFRAPLQTQQRWSIRSFPEPASRRIPAPAEEGKTLLHGLTYASISSG